MIYLDNSATTPLCPEAKSAMIQAMECYGNPSSVHAVGHAAAALLRESRNAIAEALGERYLKEGQLIFTASGTEASAIALLGVAGAKERRAARTILSTDSEHPSVAKNLSLLEKRGFHVVRVSTKGGRLDMETVRAHLNRDLFMVSMMLVNNETGALYPVAEVFAAAKSANPDCVCHCDAVQGFLKVPMSAKALGADLITLSAHKIGGPKGVGALYISPRMLSAKAIAPIYEGGGQEWGFRSGTENLIGIAGFAAAARAGLAARAERMANAAKLTAALIAALDGGEITVNLPEKRAPHILSVTLPDIKSETMLHYLSARGIAVSAGSACSSRAKGPSGTLIAFGLSPEQADCSLRVSLGADTAESDVQMLGDTLRAGLRELVRIHH